MPDVSWDGQYCAEDCTSSPKVCGPTFRGETFCCTGYCKFKFETRDDGTVGDVDRQSERMRVEILLARNGLEPEDVPLGSAMCCIPMCF